MSAARDTPRLRALAAVTVLVLMPWTWAAAPGPAHSDAGQAIPVAGELRTTLKNGLRVVVVRNPLAPVVSIEINYLVGSNEAPDGFPGTAHAQEHMMFRGSPGLTAGQLAYINAAMGGMENADTKFTVTQYSNTVPAQDLGIALQVEAIRMQSVLDSEELWAQERPAVEQEIAQDLSNPDYLLYTKLLAGLFGGTPYAHDALGTRESFDKTTGAMLKAFHDAWYAPNNAILVIVGDVAPSKVVTEIERVFGPIPARKLPQRPRIDLRPVRPQRFTLKTDHANGTVVVAFRMPGYESADYAAAQLLADALDSQRGELFGLVAEGKALATSFTLDSMPQAGLGYAAAEFPRGVDPESLVRQVRGILSKYAKDGIPEDLAEAAKRREVTELELQKNSVPGLRKAWSRALAVEGRSSPQDDIEAMKRVSAADVNRAARQYLGAQGVIVAIMAPEPYGKPVPSRPVQGKLGRGESRGESPVRSQARASAPPEWARKLLQSEPAPPAQMHPVDMTLANGLRLIVQPQSISDTVGVYGRVLNEPDLQVPPGKEGMSSVLGELFAFGTETLDRVALMRAIDDIGADLSAGTDFSVEVLNRYFDRGVQLLADNELHPRLEERSFTIVRGQVASSVAGQLNSPDYLTKRALAMALLPKGDPRLREATPQTVSALTLDDVKDYHRRVFRPDLTTIVVIGKISPEQAKAVIEKYFGAWKAQGPKPQTDLPPVPPNGPSAVAVPDGRRVQDQVYVAEMLGINRLSPDYYALQLGNHVLGGGFYATRLYHDLRERTGLVYHVGSDIDASRTRAAYIVQYACDPSNVAKAREIIERDLGEIQAAPVAEVVLQQAKRLVLTELALAQASVSSVATGWLTRARLGLPLDEPVHAARRYAALRGPDVQAAFAHRLRLADLAHITEGPTPH